MRKYMSGVIFTDDVENLQTGEKLDKSLENISDRLDVIQNDIENVGVYPATDTVNGSMSAGDKRKLDGIEDGANKYEHPDKHSVDMITGLSEVATSGSYNDLSNKPTADNLEGLVAVAKSGSYNDLSDKPNIPGLVDSVSSTSTKDAPTANALRQTHEFAAYVQKNSAKKTFDSLIEQMDTMAVAVINQDGSMLETVKRKSTEAIIATRVSAVQAESGILLKTIKFYSEDGLTLEKQVDMTVKINEDGSVIYST